MNEDTFIIYFFIIGGYILIGFLVSSIIGGFTNMDLEDYVFATLLFWPLILIIGAVFQLFHFGKAMFMCAHLDIHKPTVIYTYGLIKTSKCKYCGKKITLREDGSWK